MARFEELIFHESFEDHQAQAGRSVVTHEEALEAWEGRRRLVQNRRGQRGRYLMLGYTSAGRAVTVVLFEVQPAGLWLAYTAWDTKQSDR